MTMTMTINPAVGVRYKVLAVPYYKCHKSGKTKLMLLKDTRSGDWCFAGGGVKQKERLLDAVQRELFEETHGFKNIVAKLRDQIYYQPWKVRLHVSANTNRDHYQNYKGFKNIPKNNECPKNNIIELWLTLVFPIDEADAIRAVKHVGHTWQHNNHVTSTTGTHHPVWSSKLSYRDMFETSSACFVDVDSLQQGHYVYEQIWDVQRVLCGPIRELLEPPVGVSVSTLDKIKCLDKTPLTFPEWYNAFIEFSKKHSQSVCHTCSSIDTSNLSPAAYCRLFSTTPAFESLTHKATEQINCGTKLQNSVPGNYWLALTSAQAA